MSAPWFTWIIPLFMGWLLGLLYARRKTDQQAASSRTLQPMELKTLIEASVLQAQAPILERLEAIESALNRPKPIADPMDGLLAEPPIPISMRTIRADRSA